MHKSKFTESQIVTTLKQVEAGRQVKDVCRELGISDATYYVWKSKYGGMEGQSQDSSATQGDENFASSSAIASSGLFQPSVLRGRPLSRRAISLSRV